ncbi:MAG: DMT family transporter [Candidatus Puniceispirillales bacterium]
MTSLSRVWDIPILLLLSMIWASSFAMIKIAVPETGPFFLVVARCTNWAKLMLLVVMFSRNAVWPRDFRSWRWLVLAAAVSTALPFFLISAAETRISSSMAAILMTVGPLAAILIGHFFDDEKINRGKLVGVGTGFIATIYLLREGVAGMGNVGLIYLLLPVFASVCYAVGGFMVKKLANISSEVIAAIVLAASAVIVLPFALIERSLDLAAIRTETWGALIWLGLVTSGIAFYLRFFLLKRNGYGFVSYVGYLIPLFAIAIGMIWLKEDVSMTTIMAMSVIILGLFLTRSSSDFPWNLSPQLIRFRSLLN